jgi:endonuclease III
MKLKKILYFKSFKKLTLPIISMQKSFSVDYGRFLSPNFLSFINFSLLNKINDPFKNQYFCHRSNFYPKFQKINIEKLSILPVINQGFSKFEKKEIFEVSKVLHELTEGEIQEIIRPCGLSPQKSKAIYNLSHILIDKFNGEVPEDIQELEKLPGVGHKTASVVMSQAFGHPMFPVDTHIHRLLTKWGITSGKNVTQTEKDAKAYFPIDTWNKLHLQIIFYGREYSPARGAKAEKDYITMKIGTAKAKNELKL